MSDRITAFLKFVQIKNYRSIVDSGKFYVPADGITVFVGQNESGKTSIIDALDVFNSAVIDNEDRTERNKSTEILCTFGLSKKYVHASLEPYSVELGFLTKFFVDNILDVDVKVEFPEKNTSGTRSIDSAFLTQYGAYLESIEAETSARTGEAEVEKSVEEDEEDEGIVLLTVDELEGLLFRMIPIISIFRDDSLLPRSILLADLEAKVSKAEGLTGARNFLNVLGVEIESLKEDLASPTEKETLQTKLNRDFAADFNAFWTQEVVPGNKAKVHVALANVPAGEPNPGAEILRFTVETRGRHLFPDQRSKGFQWFLSFYLQLMVLSKDSKRPHILLIDEPGAHLHIKAKENLQAVLEQVKKGAQIIYTTHEPELIDTSKLNRVRIVTQVLNQDGSSYEGTKVYTIERSATELGTADALSPIYRAMGADLSSLKITKERNVILEEPSAYYYLTAWKKILDVREDIAFLPAMGANTVPNFFNLLTGWGFSCKIVIDDDENGRAAYNQVKEQWSISDEEAMKKFHKLRVGPTIEGLFDPVDFQKHVMGLPESEVSSSFNLASLQGRGESKALLAKRFLEKIAKKSIKKEMFKEASIDNFKEVFAFIKS